MANIHHPISSRQLEDFKIHARTFAQQLQEIDSSLVLKGRKRVDVLAKACGYSNHGQLVVLANGYGPTTVLRLFVPEHTSSIAETLTQVTGFKYEILVAAIIESANELYDDAGWTVSDIEKYGDEVWGLVFPASKKIAESIDRLTAPVRKLERLLITPFQLPSSVQKMLDMQDRLVPSAVRELTEHVNRPLIVGRSSAIGDVLSKFGKFQNPISDRLDHFK